MKKYLKVLSLVTLIIFGITNCGLFGDDDSKDKKNRNNLLAGLFLLSRNTYEATVTIVGTVQQSDNAPVRAGKISITDVTGSTAYLTTGQGTIDEFTKCQTSPASETAAQAIDATTTIDGQFTVTFKVTSASGAVTLTTVTNKNYVTSPPSSCATIANYTSGDYTSSLGTAKFTINVKNNKDKDQVTISNVSGKKVTIKSVETVVKGTYNLQSPTVGENVCDGKSVSGSPTTLTGEIASQTITSSAQLSGTVIVKSGVTLTINAGSVIFGNRGSSLFVLPGGKIVSNGTKDKPVCFTSSQTPGSRFPGDWGGLVLVGNGRGTRSSTTEGTTPQNYGSGTDDGDSSGTLKYTIVEFAGNEVAPGDELNGISLYAVGSGTTIEYVQVHRGLDDSFEAWGGAVALKYALATGGLDDDFDLDEGYTGSITNVIAHKYPTSCGGSASTDPHGFEMDGQHSGATSTTLCTNGTAARCTNPTISNFTLIGADVTSGEGARLREGFRGNLSNGIIYGFAGNTSGQIVVGSNSGSFPDNIFTIENSVYGQSGKSSTIASTSTSAMQFTLSALPITSAGDTANCGFAATKPDYTTNTSSGAPSSAGGGASSLGKWWDGWTVYRAR